MRKIDLTDYKTTGDNTFSVRQSLAAILFNEKKLDGREIIRRDELARRIETYPEDSILLETTDYDKFVSGLRDTDIQPFGRDVVEFLRRVLDAPVVDVQEKQ